LWGVSQEPIFNQIIHPLNKDCQALILAIWLLGTVR